MGFFPILGTSLIRRRAADRDSDFDMRFKRLFPPQAHMSRRDAKKGGLSCCNGDHFRRPRDFTPHPREREKKKQVESKKEAFSLLFSGLLSRSDIDKKARFIVGHKFVVLILSRLPSPNPTRPRKVSHSPLVPEIGTGGQLTRSSLKLLSTRSRRPRILPYPFRSPLSSSREKLSIPPRFTVSA